MPGNTRRTTESLSETEMYRVGSMAECKKKILAAIERKDMDLIHSRIDEAVKSLDGRKLSARLQRIMTEVTRSGKQQDAAGIAGQVHLSPAYLSFLFKQETGKIIIRFFSGFPDEKSPRATCREQHEGGGCRIKRRIRQSIVF